MKIRGTIISFVLFCFANAAALAQPKVGYYTAATLDGKNGRSLELSLQDIVYPHTRWSYDDLWEAYKTTDPGPQDSIPASYTGGKTDLIYDMYAWMKDFPKFYSDNDHSQTGGFNREHCVPNSWWGAKEGNTYAYSDLHHLVPGDGAANNAKGDYPLGEYKSGMTLVFPKENKTNTSGKLYVTTVNPASHVWKVQNSEEYGGATDIFEPADQYKGDFARMYLYLVCAYEGKVNWATTYMFYNEGTNNYTTIRPWALDLLLKWHRQDPVSQKELDRNNAVESLQENRNPFIDYPELIEYIWGNKTTENFVLANAKSSYDEAKKTASITFKLNAQLGKPFKGFTYTTNSDGATAYSSSNPEVATVDATTGKITLKSAGTTTITFTTAATATYSAGEDKYILEVVE